MTQAILGFVFTMIRVICYIAFPGELVAEEKSNIVKKTLIRECRRWLDLLSGYEAVEFKESFFKFLKGKIRKSRDPTIFELLRKFETMPADDFMQTASTIYLREIAALEKESQLHMQRMAELRKKRFWPVYE